MIGIFIFPVLLFAADAKNRVEELFIWKISDEMKLSVPEEKTFSELIRSLNQKRQAAHDGMQTTLRKMSESKSRAEKDKLLREHRRQLKKYNDISMEEIEKMEKLLGAERTTRYLVLKNDLTNRLKSLFAAPEKLAPANPLAPPQLIEEK